MFGCKHAFHTGVPSLVLRSLLRAWSYEWDLWEPTRLHSSPLPRFHTHPILCESASPLVMGRWGAVNIAVENVARTCVRVNRPWENGAASDFYTCCWKWKPLTKLLGVRVEKSLFLWTLFKKKQVFLCFIGFFVRGVSKKGSSVLVLELFVILFKHMSNV